MLQPYLLFAFYWGYSRFWKFRHIRRPPGEETRIWAHWHGDELVLVAACAGEPMAVLASRSQDGQLMGTFLRKLGFRVVRGSSSRGGAAGLKGLIDCVNKEKLDASLAVDGPRGPRGVVKPGILKLAQETTGKIYPGAAAATRKYVFKTAWNRCYLPLPFATCFIVYGDPVVVPPTASAEEMEAIRRKVESALHALKAEAETLAQGTRALPLTRPQTNGV